MRLRSMLPLILLASLMAGGATASDVEVNIDRPGEDYRDFDLTPGPGSDAGLKECLIACEQDGRCLAATYVRAGVQGPAPRCWLKERVPEAVDNDCCTSWVKDGSAGSPGPGPDEDSTPAPQGETIALQHGVNLQGDDYRDFSMAPGDTAEMCRDACQDEEQCRAFTYVRAGRHGPTPHCWLKHAVPQSYSDDQCVSGVKE